MPVKIRHIRLGDVKEVCYQEWLRDYNSELWEVLKMWDIVDLYSIQDGKRIPQGITDLNAAMDAIKNQQGQKSLDFDPLPNIGFRLPIKIPTQHDIKRRINDIIHKCKKNQLLIGVVGSLLATLILWVLGVILRLSYRDMFHAVWKYLKTMR